MWPLFDKGPFASRETTELDQLLIPKKTMKSKERRVPSRLLSSSHSLYGTCALFLGVAVVLTFCVSVITSSSASGGGGVVIDHYDYNYPSGEWSLLNFADRDGPPPRAFAASTTGSPVPPPYAPSARTGIVIFGGTTDPETYSFNFNDAWVLNPADDHQDGRTWTQVPITAGSEMPQPRCLRFISFIFDDKRSDVETGL